jgi:hypothetical protein
VTTRIRPQHLLLVLLAALLLIAPMGSAWAQGRPAPGPAVAAGKVDVKLLVVAASDSHAGIDPRLKPLQRHLQFLRYQGYELLDTHTASLAPGGDASFAIVGGRRVSVELKSRTPERAQFRIQIFAQGRKLLDTTLSVNRNGTFMVAGPRHEDGILILPLQAMY